MSLVMDTLTDQIKFCVEAKYRGEIPAENVDWNLALTEGE